MFKTELLKQMTDKLKIADIFVVTYQWSDAVFEISCSDAGAQTAPDGCCSVRNYKYTSILLVVNAQLSE